MVLMVSAGIGMDSAEFLNVPVGMTEEELSNYAWESAVNFGQMYGLEPESHRDYYEDGELEEEDSDNFTNDIEGWFEVYDSEKHDGLTVNTKGIPEFRDM